MTKIALGIIILISMDQEITCKNSPRNALMHVLSRSIIEEI